jgi:hypothetical protein
LSYFISVTLPAVGLSGGRYAVSVRFGIILLPYFHRDAVSKGFKVHSTDSMVVKRLSQIFSRIAATEFSEYDI